jgi:hypothetical protein
VLLLPSDKFPADKGVPLRKFLPAIVIGVGAFLLTLALLMRFYAVPKLAVVPLDQNSTQVVMGPNSTFLDVENLKIEKGTLKTIATVIGDPEASKEASKKTGRDLAVWDKGQYTDNNDTPPPMDGSTDRIVFDRYTGEAVNCCGENADGEPVEHKGQLVKFPFFTEKKTYDYWDGTTKKAYPAEFKGVETIMGMKVYRFEQDVPRTQTEELEVPAFLFGLPDKPIMAKRYYQNHRTFLIEPTTGVMIKLTEQQHQELEVPGAAPITALDTTSAFDDATVKKNVDDYKSQSQQLAMIKSTGPVGSGLLGAILILAGLAWSLLFGTKKRKVEQAAAPAAAGAGAARDDSTSIFGDDTEQTTRRRGDLHGN